MHALRGKEHVECDNPYDVGMTGLIGFASGYWAMKDCDTLLMLGTDFPYRQFYPEGARSRRSTSAREQLGRRAQLDLGLVGDVGDTIDGAAAAARREDATASHLDAARAHYAQGAPGLDDLAEGKPGGKADPSAVRRQLLSELAPTTRSSPATSARRRSGPRAI